VGAPPLVTFERSQGAEDIGAYMAEYGEWNRKGAVLSDKTARKEYGVTRDLIVSGTATVFWVPCCSFAARLRQATKATTENRTSRTTTNLNHGFPARC
jgi:hypothetical protein